MVTGSCSPNAGAASSAGAPTRPSTGAGSGSVRRRSIAVVESIDGVVDSLVVHLEAPDADDPGNLVLFVVLDAGVQLDDGVAARIRSGLRTGLSPRHVPDEMHQVDAIPTTLSGKKLELPVKKILRGGDPEVVASRGALKDPSALDAIVTIASDR